MLKLFFILKKFQRDILLKLTSMLQLPFVREKLCKVRSRNNIEQNTPRRNRDSMSLLPFLPVLVVHYAISSSKLQQAVQSIKFLQDNHLLFLTLNPIRCRVVGNMHLRCLVHNHLWIRQQPTRSLLQQVLHKDFEVLVRKMPQVLKELLYQREVLRHPKVLHLIKPNPYMRINEATTWMQL